MNVRRCLLAACCGALVGALVVVGGSLGATGLPAPRFGRSVDIGLVKGIVIVRPRRGVSFRLGVQDRSILTGSVIDTRRGEVDLRAARSPASASRTVQDGQFSGGLFTIRQRRSQRGLSVLDLAMESSSRSRCAQGSAGGATVARVSRRVLALLHASAHGKFRTRGRYSAGTVRGTRWDTIERCDGTLTRVHRGVVLVRDFRRHKVVAVRAGHSYLARAP